MKLKMFKRAAESKSERNAIRRAGNIPAILYVRGKAGESIAVEGAQFNALLRTVVPGRLSTTIFELQDQFGKTRYAILKEIQYAPTNYSVLHLDFEELVPNETIRIKLPIELVNINECAAVKLGGVPRQVIRNVPVRCKSQDFPPFLKLDVKSMGVTDVKRLSDIELPNTLRPLVNPNEVVVVIGKR